MKRKLVEHILSIALVTSILMALLFIYQAAEQDKETKNQQAKTDIIDFQKFDLSSQLDKALVRDLLNIYQPDTQAQNDSLLNAVLSKRQDKFVKELYQSHLHEPLSLGKIGQLAIMYLKFIIVYLIVLLITYYGVQTLAVLRFVRRKQENESYLRRLLFHLFNFAKWNNFKEILSSLKTILSLLAKAILRGVAYLVLFSPAYVIAYSMRTRFDTNTIIFMIILGVISNGLLITYANKFFSFLIIESRKGYVMTAMVKNLNNQYSKHAIDWRAIFSLKKIFGEHVFQHIYINAQYQYLSTFKEQASFLISGLIIIEMALNIHHHLGYELLQQLLYRNYDIVIVIIFGIFILVKSTEIVTDYLIERKARVYENRLGKM